MEFLYLFVAAVISIMYVVDLKNYYIGYDYNEHISV